MTMPYVWIAAGILLIVSELLSPGFIAIFFGIAAVVVGLLMTFGLLETLAAQLLVFSVLSVLLLVVARHKVKSWFMGDVYKEGSGQRFQDNFGARVVVVEEFHQGSGRVLLNGTHWDAESEDELKAGESAWIIGNRGIVLKISRTPPDAG